MQCHIRNVSQIYTSQLCGRRYNFRYNRGSKPTKPLTRVSDFCAHDAGNERGNLENHRNKQ